MKKQHLCGTMLIDYLKSSSYQKPVFLTFPYQLHHNKIQ